MLRLFLKMKLLVNIIRIIIGRVEERVEAMEEWMGEEDVDRESVKVAREKALEVHGGLEEECSRWVELYNRVSRV